MAVVLSTSIISHCAFYYTSYYMQLNLRQQGNLKTSLKLIHDDHNHVKVNDEGSAGITSEKFNLSL